MKTNQSDSAFFSKFIILILFLFLTYPIHADSKASKEQKDQIKTLLKKLKDKDRNKSINALKSLHAMGNIAQKKTFSALKGVLSKNTRTVTSAIKSLKTTPKELKSITDTWQAVIEQETLDLKVLKKVSSPLEKYYTQYENIVSVILYRQQMMHIYRTIDTDKKTRFPEEAEKSLIQNAEKKLMIDFETLKKRKLLFNKIQSEDLEISTKAIKELSKEKDLSRYQLIQLISPLLSKDLENINSANSSTPSKNMLDNLKNDFSKLREEAITLIRSLKKGDPNITKANANKLQLTSLRNKLKGHYTLILSAIDSLKHLKALAQLWKDIGPKYDQGLIKRTEELEKSISEKSGIKIENFSVISDLNNTPSDPQLKIIWLFKYYNAINKYNKSYAKTEVNKKELEFILAINDYREALGVFPFEFDLRLLQAARLRAKELSTTGQAISDPNYSKRIKEAGYTEGSVSENTMQISGNTSNDFSSWLNNAGIHQALTSSSFKQVGIGKWNHFLIICYGGGPHLMLKSEKERLETQKIEGTKVKRQ